MIKYFKLYFFLYIYKKKIIGGGVCLMYILKIRERKVFICVISMLM